MKFIEFVGVILMLVILACVAVLWKECSDQGGELVRTITWYRCMK